MRDIPIEVLAHFPLPNYNNPKTRGPALLYINGILIGITVVFVFLRVYTRVFIKRWMGADDWLILIATVSNGEKTRINDHPRRVSSMSVARLTFQAFYYRIDGVCGSREQNLLLVSLSRTTPTSLI